MPKTLLLTLTLDRVEVTLMRICGRGLPTYQIRWKSEKLFVDVRTSGRTYGRTDTPEFQSTRSSPRRWPKNWLPAYRFPAYRTAAETLYWSRCSARIVSLLCRDRLLLKILFMVALRNRADHYIFMLWFVLSFFIPRLISAAADWMTAILPHMVWPQCEFKMQVWNLLHAARWKHRTQKVAKNRHLGTIARHLVVGVR